VPLLLNATCHVVIAFAPSAVGTRQASLAVTPANGGSASVTLQSVGQGLVEIVPLDADITNKVTGLDFGQVPVLATNVDPTVHDYMVVVRGPNTTAAHTSSVLTSLVDPTTPADFSYPDSSRSSPGINPCNTGANEAVLLDFAAANANPAPAQTPTNWCKGTRVFTCWFTVKFYPQTVKGPRTATISATGSGTNAKDTKTLTGEATGPLVFDPATVSFPDGLQVGQSTNAQTSTTIITLSGNDRTAMLINRSATADIGPVSLVLGGANADQFLIVGDRCSTTTLLHAGGNCSVTIAFVPTSVGAKTATLTATAGGETTTLVINAGAIDAFNLTITPGALETAPYDFGTIAQTLGSDWVAFTVTNPAGSPRSAQVGFTEDPLNYFSNGGRFIIANGINHARGTCGIPGVTSLAPGGTCTILVQFKPQADDDISDLTDTGDWMGGSFWVQDWAKGGAFTDAFVKGTVGSKVTISPAAYTFPDTAEGATSAATTLTITNKGSVEAKLVIQDNSILAPFNVDQAAGCGVPSARTLAAGATCNLVVTFIGQGNAGGTPSATAKKTLLIGDTDSAASAQTDLTGTTVKPAKLEAVGFAALAGQGGNTVNLGGVRKGSQSGSVTLTFKNSGSVATDALHFQWGGLATDVADPEFVILSETGTGCVGKTSLAAGATCTVTVNFAPSSTSVVGTRTPKLFVLSAAQGGIVDDFQFTAAALDPASSGWMATATPALGFFAFPGMTPSPVTTAPMQLFQLTNGTAAAISALGLGITALNGASTGVSGDFELVVTGTDAGTAPCGGTLAASASCTFAVKFHPTTWTSTTVFRHAQVTVTAAEIPGASMGIWGKVQSPAQLVLTPVQVPTADFYAFGQVVIGQNVVKSFTVTNAGETASAAVAMSLVNTVGSGFTVAGGCNVVLAASATCTGTLTASPGANLGNFAATLQATAVGATPSATVAVTGAGVIDTTLTVDHPTMTFGTQAVGIPATSGIYIPQVAILSNLGGARNSGVVKVTLADTQNFVLDTDTCSTLENLDGTPRGLSSGESCAAVVFFQPQTLGTGTFTTTLTFTATPGSTQTVTITGTAVSALKVSPVGPVTLDPPPATPPSVANPFTVNVWLEPGADATDYIKTSISGSAFIIVEDQCVANKLRSGYSCHIKVAYVGGAVTPLKTSTLTINGGSAGNSASVVFNSTTPPAP